MSRGAPQDSTDIDRFIAACRRADRRSAKQIRAEHPDLLDRLSEDDGAAILEAVGSASVAIVGLMLHLGSLIDAGASQAGVWISGKLPARRLPTFSAAVVHPKVRS